MPGAAYPSPLVQHSAHPSRVDEIVARWAVLSPSRPALVEDTGAWSYAGLDAAIAASRNWLLETGAGPGDRVMIVGENCRALVALFFAIVRLDAWPLVVNARLSGHEIDQIRAHSGARLVLFTTDVSPHAKAHAGRYQAVSANPLDAGAIAVAAATAAVEPERVETDPMRQVAALVYTSGTTGRPKGVMLTHANLLFVARTAGALRGLCIDDRFYAVVPISHILGLTGVMLSTLYYGATLHLAPRFDPAAALRALAADGVSVVHGTPAMYALLGEYVRRKRLATVPQSALRVLAVAGAPLDPAIKSDIESLFGLPLHNGYGITECSPSISQMPLGERRGDLSVGRILPGLEARLAGPDGAAARAGEVGELRIRGPGVMKGYYKAPEETAAVLSPDGWFNTQDLARFEGEYLFIAGRTKELIIRFGFNVYPAEIEAVLNAHETVTQAAVIGRQTQGDEEVIAFIQPVAGTTLTAAAMADYAAQRLASYKRPSRFFIVSELPATTSGKILKSALPALADSLRGAKD